MLSESNAEAGGCTRYGGRTQRVQLLRIDKAKQPVAQECPKPAHVGACCCLLICSQGSARRWCWRCASSAETKSNKFEQRLDTTRSMDQAAAPVRSSARGPYERAARTTCAGGSARSRRAAVQPFHIICWRKSSENNEAAAELLSGLPLRPDAPLLAAALRTSKLPRYYRGATVHPRAPLVTTKNAPDVPPVSPPPLPSPPSASLLALTARRGPRRRRPMSPRRPPRTPC